MADDPNIQPPKVEQTTETHETITQSGVATGLPPTHDEKTRRLIIWWIFIQFNVFIMLTITAMIFKGWELSPASTNVIMIVLTGELSSIGTAVGFYLGATSAVKVAKP